MRSYHGYDKWPSASHDRCPIAAACHAKKTNLFVRFRNDWTRKSTHTMSPTLQPDVFNQNLYPKSPARSSNSILEANQMKTQIKNKHNFLAELCLCAIRLLLAGQRLPASGIQCRDCQVHEFTVLEVNSHYAKSISCMLRIASCHELILWVHSQRLHSMKFHTLSNPESWFQTRNYSCQSLKTSALYLVLSKEWNFHGERMIMNAKEEFRLKFTESLKSRKAKLQSVSTKREK